jgi:hypothetical protein
VKIQGWIVEQFGALRDHEVSEIPDGLTVFCGPNGSGKSTLVAFLRETLYGSARAIGATSDFAVDDDTRAGRIDCAGPHGVYTIAVAGPPSRVRIIRPNGEDGDEVDLQCLFGGPEGALIGSLLAFDVRDLQSLPSLSCPGLRDRIFPATVGHALVSLDRVLDRIQTSVSKIAQPCDGAVERLLVMPPELHERLERASRAASRHAQLLQAQARALVDVDARTQTISDLKAERARYVALVDLWPVWQELAQARHDLAHVEPSFTLPANPDVRLEQTLAARQAARYSVDQLVDRGSALRPAVSVTLDEPAGAALRAIEAHASESGRFGSPAHDRIVPTEGGGTQLALRPATADSAPDRPESRPRRDRPGPGPEELSTWQRRLQEVQDDLRERQRELDAAQRTVRELERARNELAGQAKLPEPLSAVVLQEEGRLLQRVRAALAGVSGDHDAVRRWQELIAERRRLMRSLEGQISRLPSATLAYVAGLAGVLGMAAAAWRHVAGDTTGFALLLGCSLVGVAGAAIQRSRRVRAIEDNSTCRSRLIALREEVEHACQSLLHHEEQVARRRFDISVDSVRLGLPPAPTQAQLQEREAEFEEQQHQRDDWDSVHAALANTTAALTSSQEIERQHAQSLAAAQAHARQVAQEWQRWKADARLADGADRAGGAHRAGADPLQDCQHLITTLAEDERSAARPAHVRLPIDERDFGSRQAAPPRPAPEPSPALQAALRRLRQCEDDLARLFTEAGVSDEASYRARLAIYQRHAALERTIRASEMRLDERLKDEPASEAIRRELPRGHVDEWSSLAARAAEELNALEAARDEALRHLQQLDADARSAAAESVDLPVLEVEQAGWATEAREAIRRWRTLALAGSLLAELRRTLECESQPLALRRASQVLSALSCARYERVIPSRDQRELLVVDARTGLKPATQLNRAAAEQLYFGLRLGLAEEHAQQGTALPIIIDDVLDSFDPSRRRAMAQQIVQLSGRHQVFVFTSQPDTCELLSDLDPDAHVVRMPEL